ncbi:MAG: deoxyribose-phosphate aldolase [Syntrophomonadaceae bacterium]|nr:deoxyribose-phosphate aldolase [Syntrophomonadaceae bacterium]
MKRIFGNSAITINRAADLASIIDHTSLRPEATAAAIEALCQEARHYAMAAVCVNPGRLSVAARALSGSGVKLCTVIGFPLGADARQVKRYAAEHALLAGADEIDMVIDIGAVKDGDYAVIAAEIAEIIELKSRHDFVLKAIVETALLSISELTLVTKLIGDSGADFIKTSTGFAARGASVENIKCINAARPPHLKIKASGGIRTLEQALELVAAGADRLGCSGSVAIIEEFSRRQEAMA